MIEERRVQNAGQNGRSSGSIACLSANARPDGVALFDLLNIVGLCCGHGLTLCRTVLVTVLISLAKAKRISGFALILAGE